ncbi:hypothetical protein F4805DRAFT_475702 [Annulohypoxylon moriforme]|nr:hypothetical protein F4805DRAFT_475702 [Annulohypoxylon moriforme]
MFTTELNSTYRQYKADTNYIATWLATTAKLHGYQSEHLDPAKAPSRLKGKARKQAKQEPKPSGHTYVIAIREFIPLAQFIRDQQPDIPVPVSLAASLRRAIRSRGNFSGLLEKNGYDLNALADHSHQHFVGILARVCNVLRPRFVFNQTPSNKEESCHDDVTGFENYFSRLSSEETIELPNDDNYESPTSEFIDTPEGKIQYEAEEQTTRDDALFALYHVIGDISEIRDQTSETWNQVFIESQDYSFYPLASAALLTNLGIELARDLVEEVSQICETHGGVRHLLEVLCAGTAAASGLSKEQIWDQSDETGKFNTDNMYCFEEEFFLTPLYVLSLHMESQMQWKVDTNQIFPLKKDTTGREKEITDVTLLHWYFAESSLHAPTWEKLAQDEVMKAKDIHALPAEPIQVALAGQIFLDIHHRYGEKVTKAYSLMIQQLDQVRIELQKYRKFESTYSCCTKASAKLGLRTADQIWALLNTVVSPRNSQFLKRNPLLCGLTVFFFQSELEEFGVNLLNTDPTMIASAHLYNALRKEQLLGQPWQDLELLMTVLPKSAFFVGEDRPSGLSHYRQRFLLQLGVPASAFAPKGRRLPKFKRTVKQREIPGDNRFIQLLKAKYKAKKDTTSSHWTKEFLEAFLNEASHEEVFKEIRDCSGNIETHQLMMTSNQANSRTRPSLEEYQEDTHVCAKPNLFTEEVPRGRSDSFCFPIPINTMGQWLQRVREACEPILERHYLGFSCEPNRHDYFVSYLFTAAADKTFSSGTKINILQVAAKAVDKFATSELADEAAYRLYRSMGLVFTEGDKCIVCRYIEPPRPNQKDITKWRKLTGVQELFAEVNGEDDTTSTEHNQDIEGPEV